MDEYEKLNSAEKLLDTIKVFLNICSNNTFIELMNSMSYMDGVENVVITLFTQPFVLSNEID